MHQEKTIYDAILKLKSSVYELDRAARTYAFLNAWIFELSLLTQERSIGGGTVGRKTLGRKALGDG